MCEALKYPDACNILIRQLLSVLKSPVDSSTWLNFLHSICVPTNEITDNDST